MEVYNSSTIPTKMSMNTTIIFIILYTPGEYFLLVMKMTKKFPPVMKYTHYKVNCAEDDVEDDARQRIILCLRNA